MFVKKLEQLNTKGGYDIAVIKCEVLKCSLKENKVDTIKVVFEN